MMDKNDGEPRDEYQGLEVLEVNVTVATCNRCGFEWHPKVSIPKQCSRCKSPFWNRDRKMFPTGSSAANKYGFDKIKLNEWSYFPFFLDKNAAFGVDAEANARQSRSLEQFMRRKGWSYEHKLGKNADGVICLMIKRTK